MTSKKIKRKERAEIRKLKHNKKNESDSDSDAEGDKTVIQFNSENEYKGFEVISTLKIPIQNVAPCQYLIDKSTIKLLKANHVKFTVITEIKGK